MNTKKSPAKKIDILDTLLKIISISPSKLGFLIVLLCVFSLQLHYSRSIRLTHASFDWVGSVENAFLDMRFLLRGPKKVSDKIGIIAIDDETLAKFGRWPLNRQVYEKPIKVLKEHGVKWLGIDVYFTEPERPLLEESIPGIQEALEASITNKGFNTETFENKFSPLLEASLGDRSLANAFKNFGNVMQSYFFQETLTAEEKQKDFSSEMIKIDANAIDMVGFKQGINKKIEDLSHMMSQGLTANIPIIAESTQFQGFTDNEAIDSDALVRKVGLVKIIAPKDPKTKEFIGGQPKFFPGMPLAVAANYLNRVVVIELDDIGVNKIRLMDAEDKAEPIDIPLTHHSRGWALLNHYGPPGTFSTYSLAAIAEGKIPKKMPEIMYMGATATGTSDMRPSPFGRSFPGVEHLAAMTENILTKNFLNRPEQAVYYELAFLIISGLLLTALLNKVSALKSLLVMLSVVILVFFIDRYFFFGKGYWVYLGTFYAQSFAIYVSVTVFKYFTEEKEKAKVRDAFQHYLNPAVITQLMEHPEKLKLGGEKKVLTAFFSDVRGFSTISEAMTPEGLTALLNEYFTPMTQIILDTGGLLDKYIGDAIMAIWGAPIDLPDHPDRAVEACLKMLDALEVLRAGWKIKGMPLIDIGMGVNTGEMTVGNMGGNQRFDYTVMGDAVNLASRLEGTNKMYRTRTIISDQTRVALKRPEKFLLRELDLIVVKGKTEPVTIFEVVNAKPHNIEKYKQIVGMFGEGLKAYRKQNWQAANKIFNEILQIHPNDGPTITFLEKCAYLAEHPPGDDWNGVWHLKEK